MRRVLWLALVGLLSGCTMWQAADVPAPQAAPQRVTRAAYLTHLLNAQPEFREALPLMRFDRVSQAGLSGEGARALVIDFFGGDGEWGPEHGWAVLETLMTVAPDADYWIIDLDQVAREIQQDGQAPLDPVVRALEGARSWSRAGGGVINMSFGYPPAGGCTSGNVYNGALAKSLRQIARANVNLVASAGNWGGNTALYPGCAPEVLSVGSVYDADDTQARWLPDPDVGFAGCTDRPVRRGMIACNSHPGELYAVGASVDGYEKYRGRQPFTGSSVAAPFASGALILLRATGLNAGEARAQLVEAAEVRTAQDGARYRLLDAAAALGLDQSSQTPPGDGSLARFADANANARIDDGEARAVILAWVRTETLHGVRVTDARMDAVMQAWVMGLPV